jgi:hypothetical protein
MLRAGLFLALVTALVGCTAPPKHAAPPPPPPTGVLVEYHEGGLPEVRPAAGNATYALHAVNQTGAIATCRPKAGEMIGFSLEGDGSLWSVAPKQALPLAPGAYVWEVVPGSVKPPKPKHDFFKNVTVVIEDVDIDDDDSAKSHDKKPAKR